MWRLSSLRVPEDQPDDNTPAEVSPNGRYLRYNILLGRGACKRVWKAFDIVDGVEVAWNQVEMIGLDREDEVRERLFAEIHTLQALHHRHIMAFHDWWFTRSTQTINFVTEIFTSGTLRQYRKRMRSHINEGVIKRWAWQVLQGLVYLHAHDPPIVHRDLKCDNIFVNGSTGTVKIGDLGLATAQQGLSVVGTPEFMAPEVYEECYDEKVDIYGYGMVLLELATLEYPYRECHGVAQIYKKVVMGVKPQALARVPGEELRALIEQCIAHDPRNRPAARQLVKHPFFDSLRRDGGMGLGSSGLMHFNSSGSWSMGTAAAAAAAVAAAGNWGSPAGRPPLQHSKTFPAALTGQAAAPASDVGSGVFTAVTPCASPARPGMHSPDNVALELPAAAGTDSRTPTQPTTPVSVRGPPMTVCTAGPGAAVGHDQDTHHSAHSIVVPRTIPSRGLILRSLGPEPESYPLPDIELSEGDVFGEASPQDPPGAAAPQPTAIPTTTSNAARIVAAPTLPELLFNRPLGDRVPGLCWSDAGGHQLAPHTGSTALDQLPRPRPVHRHMRGPSVGSRLGVPPLASNVLGTRSSWRAAGLPQRSSNLAHEPSVAQPGSIGSRRVSTKAEAIAALLQSLAESPVPGAPGLPQSAPHTYGAGRGLIPSQTATQLPSARPSVDDLDSDASSVEVIVPLEAIQLEAAYGPDDTEDAEHVVGRTSGHLVGPTSGHLVGPTSGHDLAAAAALLQHKTSGGSEADPSPKEPTRLTQGQHLQAMLEEGRGLPGSSQPAGSFAQLPWLRAAAASASQWFGPRVSEWSNDGRTLPGGAASCGGANPGGFVPQPEPDACWPSLPTFVGAALGAAVGASIDATNSSGLVPATSMRRLTTRPRPGSGGPWRNLSGLGNVPWYMGLGAAPPGGASVDASTGDKLPSATAVPSPFLMSRLSLAVGVGAPTASSPQPAAFVPASASAAATLDGAGAASDAGDSPRSSAAGAGFPRGAPARRMAPSPGPRLPTLLSANLEQVAQPASSVPGPGAAWDGAASQGIRARVTTDESLLPIVPHRSLRRALGAMSILQPGGSGGDVDGSDCSSGKGVAGVLVRVRRKRRADGSALRPDAECGVHYPAGASTAEADRATPGLQRRASSHL